MTPGRKQLTFTSSGRTSSARASVRETIAAFETA
jgi:hypothetical protein